MPEFVTGLFYNQPSEKAPDFILANMSIKPLEFIAWLSEQKQNENGYVKLVAKKSKAGKAYIELDTWKPTNKKEEIDYQPQDPVMGVDGIEVPF